MLCTTSCLLALALPQHVTAATEPVRDAEGAFGYDYFPAGNERLKSYAWDGGAAVPFLGSAPSVRIEFGEAGLASDARLYLPCSGLLEALASGAQVLEQRGLVLDEGRYGQALRFDASSSLRLALPAPAPLRLGWSLSLWVRPEGGAAGRSLVLLPGAVELVLQSDLRVRAALLPSGEQLVHPDPLALGAWSFVSLSYDPAFIGQLGLGVNGRAASVNLVLPGAPRQASELWAGDHAHAGRGFVGALDELLLEPGTRSTARAERVFRPELRPGRHVLELGTTLGLRTVELAAHATRELWLDDAADFAPGELEGVAWQNGGLCWVPGRWSELHPRHAPPARTTHPLVALDGSRLLTFGGETRDTHLWPMRNTSDTWIFDGAAGEWSEVAGTPAPPPRCHVPAAYSPDHELVLLVGGWLNSVTPGQVYADTWVFHVASGSWEQRFPSGPALYPLSDQGLVYLPELRAFLLLKGGRNWLYDPDANAWQTLAAASAVTETGQPTSYALGASTACALDPQSGLVLCFGGSYGSPPTTFSDTTALYDVHTNTYTVLAPPVRPAPRVRGALAYDPRGRRFVLYGGVLDQYSQRFDDLWAFDPRTRAWSELGCSSRPGPRGGYYGLAYDPGHARFVLYGGRAAYERWLDETWALELDDARAGTALYTLDRLESWGRTRFLADVQTPGGSAVAFRFRTSDSGSSWSPWSRALADGRERFVQIEATLRPGPLGDVPRIRAMGLR